MTEPLVAYHNAKAVQSDPSPPPGYDRLTQADGTAVDIMRFIERNESGLATAYAYTGVDPFQGFVRVSFGPGYPLQFHPADKIGAVHQSRTSRELPRDRAEYDAALAAAEMKPDK